MTTSSHPDRVARGNVGSRSGKPGAVPPVHRIFKDRLRAGQLPAPFRMARRAATRQTFIVLKRRTAPRRGPSFASQSGYVLEVTGELGAGMVGKFLHGGTPETQTSDVERPRRVCKPTRADPFRPHMPETGTKTGG